MGQTFGDEVGTVILQAVVDDDGVVLGQAKEAGFGIAFGRGGRDGADFDVAEPEAFEEGDGFTVFVIACGKADRVGKVEAAQVCCEARVGDGVVFGNERRDWRVREDASGLDGEFVGAFGITLE